MRLALAGFALAMWVSPAHAYCVHNQLKDRLVRVEQEPHPDKLRGERVFQRTLRPGERQCCSRRNLDCNPDGRRDSIVSLVVTLPEEPAHHCGYPEGDAPIVKVTGGGSVRIQHNPRRGSAAAYIVRVATHDKDITGPRGVACPAINAKGKP